MGIAWNLKYWEAKTGEAIGPGDVEPSTWALAEVGRTHTAADYLRAGEAVSPLQHIWSMSVQGQFYIALLLLVAGCAYLFRRRLGARLRASFIVLLTALTVASFGYAIVAHLDNQSIAYYDSFARQNLANVDLLAAKELGIRVSNTPGVAATAVAEHALMLILAVARQIVQVDNEVRAGKWPRAMVPSTCGRAER